MFRFRNNINRLRDKFRILFPFREEIGLDELLQIIYGRFDNLKEYVNLLPKDKQ